MPPSEPRHERASLLRGFLRSIDHFVCTFRFMSELRVPSLLSSR
jgi:hypothetical protein